MPQETDKVFDASVLGLLAEVDRTIEADADGRHSRLMCDYCAHASRVMNMDRLKATTEAQRQLGALLADAFAAGARTIERAWREVHGCELR